MMTGSSARDPSPSRAAVRRMKKQRRADQKRFAQELQRFDALAPVARALNKTVLETASVQLPTIRDYVRRLGWFRHHLDSRRSAGADLEASADEAIAAWFDLLFQRGHSSADGQKFLAALQHLWPGLQAKVQLPRSCRVVKGWWKLRPLRSRAPLPFQALMGILGALLHRGLHDEATAVLIAFVGYLRPSELLAIQPDTLVPPLQGAPGLQRCWGIILGDFAKGKSNKTGEFDESVLLDWPDLDFLSPVLLELHQRPANRPVWDFDAPHLTTALKTAAAEAMVDTLEPQLYSLRHGGASFDCLTRRRPLSEVKKRGRWRRDASVRRYEKAAVAARQAYRLPVQALDYVGRVRRLLGDIFLRRVPAPVPPAPARARRTSTSC